MLIARFKHVAMPQFEQVTDRPLRGVNGPAARWDTELIAVGVVRGSSKCGSWNISEWLQPRNRIPASKPRRGGIPRAEPVDYEVRPLSLGRERVRAPMERGRVGVQAPKQGLWR